MLGPCAMWRFMVMCISGTPNLVVDTARGELLIPLAQEICVDVDLAARRIDGGAS